MSVHPARRSLRLLGAAAVGLGVLAGCGAPAPVVAGAPASDRAEVAGVTLLSPDRWAAAVADPRRFVVDVHVPFEGTVPGTDVAVPYTDVEQAVARGALPADRTTPIAVYCRTGPMSAEASSTLSRLGYRDVVDLAGGMQAWTASGRPLLGTAAPTP